ncbi:MAG: transcriptional repressor [Spirochaetales bacterium]
MAKLNKSALRDRILQLVQSTHIHPTAAWIFDKLRDEFPRVAIGTVYRNLNILVTEGLIKNISFNEPLERYDGNLIHHYHFICESCGVIQDLEIPPIKKLESQVKKTIGLEVNHHRIDFYGICPACSAKGAKEKPLKSKE